VGIVLIVLSWGSLTEMVVTVYEAVLAAIGTAIASVTIAAAVAATITALIFIAAATAISFVAREAGEWAAEQWGPAWGAVVTIVTTLAMSWAIGAGFENLNVTIPPATLPMTVLNVTNAMLAGLATFTTAEFQALREAQSQWNDYIASPENPMKELERLMDEWFPENSLQTIAQEALFGPKETLDQFLGRTLTMVDGLTYRLTLPITHFTELTLTPRLL
jgi:hypothetical protein